MKHNYNIEIELHGNEIYEPGTYHIEELGMDEIKHQYEWTIRCTVSPYLRFTFGTIQKCEEYDEDTLILWELEDHILNGITKEKRCSELSIENLKDIQKKMVEELLKVFNSGRIIGSKTISYHLFRRLFKQLKYSFNNLFK